MKLHYLQHVAFEGLGSIESWAQEKKFSISVTRMFEQDPLPKIEEFDWLVVMGGPMNIYEHKKYPWLQAEKKFIKNAITSGKTVLGVCLGAQLIADVLGAKVYSGEHKEIGWFPVEFTNEAKQHGLDQIFPNLQQVMHWHGDTFPLPKGAIPIAESKACKNQGFVYKDRVIALQFHLETTRESLQSLIKHCGDELVQGTYIQQPEEMLKDEKSFEQINRGMDHLLNHLHKQSTQEGKPIS